MIQEASPTRGSMALNVAEPVLPGLYDLFVDALGSTAGWWVGHLTLIGIIMFVYWVITNWKEIVYGLEISGGRFAAWLAIIGLTVAQYVFYQSQYGFPASGSFIMAVSVSGYLWWQWYQLEPAKA